MFVYAMVAVAMFHVILRQAGPEFDPALPLEQQTGWDEHAAYMDSLVEAGHIVLGGPLPERPRRPRDAGGVGGGVARDLGARPVARVTPDPGNDRAVGDPARLALAPQRLQLALDLALRVAGRDVAPLVAQLLPLRERELDLHAYRP